MTKTNQRDAGMENSISDNPQLLVIRISGEIIILDTKNLSAHQQNYYSRIFNEQQSVRKLVDSLIETGVNGHYPELLENLRGYERYERLHPRHKQEPCSHIGHYSLSPHHVEQWEQIKRILQKESESDDSKRESYDRLREIIGFS